MRVYVPATIGALGRLHERGSLGSAPTFGCAVTPDLRERFSDTDDDELDYTAMGMAALESLRILAADGHETRRRVVLAVEVADGSVDPDPAAGWSAVRVLLPLGLDDVVAIYVDGDDAVATVTSAAAMFDAADRGDSVATRTVDAADEHELLWYGTQELATLVGR